jgi:hypothetical protein
MDDDGNIIEVHAGANYVSDLYYMVGTLNAGAKTITWAPSVKYDTGTIPAVAVTKDGNIIEVHCGANYPQDHYYRIGGLTRAYGGSSVSTIEWGDAFKYDTGGSLAVAVDDLGNVVEVHCGYNHPSEHSSIVGSMRV